MSTDITVLGLGVDTSQIKAATTSLDALSRAGNQAQTSATGMESGFNRLRNVMAGLALGMTAIELVKMADAMSLMEARLKLTTGNAADFAKAQGDIYRISQAAGVGIAETAALYIKLNEPVKNLGGTTRETTAIVTAFSAALKLGGANTQEAAAATLQFAQAMGSGKLQGDEFRSLAEASPRFMKALADGMDVPIGTLKKLGTEGKLTADIVGNALMKSLGQLKSEMSTLPVTVGVAMERLKNDFRVAINDINKSAGVTLGIAGLVDEARKLIPAFKTEAIDAFTSIGNWIESNRDGIEDIWTNTKALGAELWEVAKAVGGVLLGIGNWLVQSEALKYSVEVLRFLVAGLKDGMDLLGAGFAYIGAQLLKVVGIFSESAALAAKEAESYAMGIFDRFSNGDTAVQHLGVEMAKTTANTTQLREALMTSGLSASDNANEIQRLSGHADMASTALTTLKNKHTELSDEQKRSLKAFGDLTDKIKEQIAEVEAENTGTSKLNEAQKARIGFIGDLGGKYKSFSDEQALVVDGLISEWEKTLDVKKAKEDLAKEIKGLTDANEKYNESLHKELTQVDVLLEKQREENQQIGMTAIEVTNLKAAKYDKLAADAAEEASYIRLTDAGSEQAIQLDKIAEKYKGLATGVRDGGMLAEIQKQNEAWKNVTETLGQGLADALMGGWGSFKDFLKKQLVNFIIRIPLQGVMTSIVGGIGSMLGMPAMAGQGAGGNILSSLGSMGSTLGNFGSLLGEGIGGVQSLLGFGGTGIAGTVAGIGGAAGGMVGGATVTPAILESMIGTAGYGASAAGAAALAGVEGAAGAAAAGAASGVAGAASAALGALAEAAPYLAIAYAIYSAFKHNPTPHLGGYAAFDASGVPNTTYGAGESNRSPELDRMVSSMLQPVYASLNSLASTFDPTGHRFGVAGTFKAEEAAEDGAWGVVQISHGGSTIFKRADGTLAADAEEGFGQYTQLMATSMREAIDLLDLPTWAADTLAAIGDSPSLDKLIETVNAISATVAGVNMMTEALEPLGGLFTKIAGLSQEAKIELAGMVGGIDALVQKSQSFVANYYSDEEQASIQARSILEAAQKAGVDSATFDKIAGLTSRGSLRALGDTIDLSAQGGNGVPSGLELAALLLNIQGTFANLTGEKGFLETSGMTLGELAGKSINPTILDVLAAATAAAAAGGDATTVTDAADTGDAASGDAATDATSADIVQINPAVLEAVADNTEYAVSLLTEIRDSIAASVKASSEVTVTAMQILVSVDSHLEKLEDMTYMAALAPATN